MLMQKNVQVYLCMMLLISLLLTQPAGAARRNPLKSHSSNRLLNRSARQLITATAPATATVEATVEAAAESPLAAEPPSETPAVVTGTDGVAAAAVVTADEGVATAESLTLTDAAAETSQLDAAPSSARSCAIQPALDLAGYPNLVGTLGCPQSEGSFEPVALNEFSGSVDEADETSLNPYMLWFGAEERIYALLPSGQI